MAPQDSAHRAGSHATVPCVGCHIGQGVRSHLQGKLRGLEHFSAQLSQNYQRPIRVVDARYGVPDDRCLSCHSLAKIPQSKLRQSPRYLYDAANSAWQVSLTLHIGAHRSASDSDRGIMWHMSNPSRVRFATTDPNAGTIPWVRVRLSDGSESTFIARDWLQKREALEQLPRRYMTCSDCHNRTGHDQPHLDESLDRALYNGEISTSLPSAKRRISGVLSDEHLSPKEVETALATALSAKAPSPNADREQIRRAEADRAGTFATKLNARAVFPHLRVDWSTYPSHIGHRFSPGCFRCHDGEHIDSSGRAIPSDCATTCHSAPALSPVVPSMGVTPPEPVPWHPWQLPLLDFSIAGHDRLKCSDCHALGVVPKLACEDCHHPPGI